MPKHRGTLYAVVRVSKKPNEYDSSSGPVVIGAYATFNRAEEIKGSSEQTMKDLGFDDLFKFEVQPVTWYDE